MSAAPGLRVSGPGARGFSHPYRIKNHQTGLYVAVLSGWGARASSWRTTLPRRMVSGSGRWNE